MLGKTKDRIAIFDAKQGNKTGATLPDGFMSYAVYGASIYAYDGLTYTALRLARKPGEFLHPYPGWTLNTPSVIPPKELL